MENVFKCDLCIYRDDSKTEQPCAVCSDNKNYISRFKEHPVVNSCRQAWGITETKEGV